MKQRILIAFVLLLVPVASAQVYTISDLGPLSPTAINAWGQVVGDLNGHAFLWTRWNGMRDLGVLPGATFSNAAAINDLGVVTGTSDGPGTLYGVETVYCPNLAQPYLWNAFQGMKALGVMLFDGETGDVSSTEACHLYDYATGVDVLGRVVGADRNFGDNYRYGFLWRRPSSVENFFDFQTIANGINNKNQVVGQTGGIDLEVGSHAVLWYNGFRTYLDTNVKVVDTGVTPYDQYCSGANGINDVGQVVGWSNMGSFQCPFFFFLNPEGVVHAFVWKTGAGMQDLGTLMSDTVSVARKVNYFGIVIGSSGNTLSWEDGPVLGGGSVQVIGRPFIWSQSSGMRDLNTLIPATSGWVLDSATDINVWGQIVGSGTLNGQTHGFLLTPINL